MEKLAEPLQNGLAGKHECFRALLAKFGQGLDDVRPFSDTIYVDTLVREAERIFTSDSNLVGPKNASRIWAFMSKFVIFDRFAKTLGLDLAYPGKALEKKMMSTDTFGGGSKLLDDLKPPTKIIRKFLKTWGDREKSRAQYAFTAQQQLASNEGQEPAGVALTLSRRLIAVVKVKKILNVEAGLEMMALAMTIASENSGVFPETANELQNFLRTIWLNRLDDQQFEEILMEMQLLHKLMKNMMEFVFATSPLLALSTGGWLKSIQGTYLLRLFIALGNDRPEILIRLEDQVLQAIIGLCEGRPRGDVMDGLCLQLGALEKDLANDDYALEWFNLTLAAPSMLATPLLTELALPANIFKGKLQGGLLSPPESQNASPVVSLTPSSSSLPLEKLPPPHFADARHCIDRTDCCEGELVHGESHKLMEEQVHHLSDMVPNLNLQPRSRRSSCSTLTDISQMDCDDNPSTPVTSAVDSEKWSKLSTLSQVEKEVHPKKFVEPRKALSDPLEDDGGDPMVGVESRQPSSDSEKDVEDDRMNESDDPCKNAAKLAESKEPTIARELNQMSVDSDLAGQLSTFEIRRSSRHKPNIVTPLEAVGRPKLWNGKRKGAPKGDKVLVLGDLEAKKPKLSNVGPATFHPRLYADIAGWGSTVEDGAKSYHHVPVQIVRPGNVASTGDDTDTLRKVEARIQGEFIDGLPPHLLPNAKDISYLPGSAQSRIFVSSSSEFSSLGPVDIQSILRHRVILVHGLTFDYDYGWDLPSFGRIYDVDKKISVLVSSLFHPHKPEIRHHEGTLREFHGMTTPQLNERFPPLNALCLPAKHRNLYVPSQLGSFASHEVAQSRLPPEYETEFDIPDLRSKLEWSIIGGEGAISPFHIDSDGLGTVVVVLEGTKYWVVATRVGEEESICTADSLPPDWEPYYMNDGNKIDGFRFEAVHLQKGDMLIMPPGVLHWVLSTSNAICVGRHFYSSSTIRWSIVSIVRAFFLGGALTNEDNLRTRTLLYQLLVFWSMRMDKRDVDGAHIPSFSSEEGFFDIVYLGIFVILSPAFDRRFYFNPPPSLVNEVTYSIQKFQSLLHVFSSRFIIFLGGEAVSASYIQHRMLAEFAAAAVVFAKSAASPFGKGDNEGEGGISFPRFQGMVEGVLLDSCRDILPFFSSRTDSGHNRFLWSGPNIEIIPRSRDVLSILQLTRRGELLDVPGCTIYHTAVDDTSSAPRPPAGKRHRSQDKMEDSKRRKH